MRSVLKNASFEYNPSGRGGARGRFIGFDLFGRRYGFDRSTVYVGNERYLDRWILYVAGVTLRCHRFWRGDDDRASHTHPWWFITFPLSTYVESIYDRGTFVCFREVKAWRPHFRPASFEHYVVGKGFVRAEYVPPFMLWAMTATTTTEKPFWTLVLTGPKAGTWGFYPKPGMFVNWKDWT